MKNQATSRNSSSIVPALEQGRESFRKQAWGAAFAYLAAADREASLAPEHIMELAQAALLIGRDAEGADFLARAHQAFVSQGRSQPAARCAFWLGFTSLLNGEMAKAGGWLSRAGRLLETHPDCVEQGYLLLPQGLRSFHEGDAVAAGSHFQRATAIGERFSDKDLVTLGLQGQGRALIRQGETARGLALLDEAMIAVTAGEVSALNAGGVYCSVLDACGEILDLQRAQEWTAALHRWCASQPDLVPYRGHCLVRRAELLQLRGAWSDALAEAQHASEWLSDPVPKPAMGAALYQVGEIQRMRGNFTEAEAAYRRAAQWQSVTGPGMALLRLAQGQQETALAMVRRMKEEGTQRAGARAIILSAYVEIVLAANDVGSAHAASKELTEIATRIGVPFLAAMASRSAGAVLLAESGARGALVKLKESWKIWCELQAPYEAARTRVLIAMACRQMGDEDEALLELTAAGEAFRKLGAAADLAGTTALLSKPAPQKAGPLTDRELQVLRLIASGTTNRGIAEKLHISEKTVARHISNIFNKLDLSSRTAAAAYAYDHHLV